MKTRTKVALAAPIVAGLLGGLGIGTIVNSAPAHATISDVSVTLDGDDSYQATCGVWSDNAVGTVRGDLPIAQGIAQAIAQHYGLGMPDAIKVENYQVETYCPKYWPNLVAIGNYYRSGGGSGPSSTV